MKVKITLLLLLLKTALFAQAPVLDWAAKFGGIRAEQGKSVVTDASGNIYSTGIFSGTADFDPSSTVAQELIAFGTNLDNPDVYIMKQNAAGGLIWAKQIGSNGVENVSSITIDNQGNVYTVGTSNGNTDFDPSPTSAYILNSIGAIDCFISKLDSNGNFVWARRFGGTQYNVGNGIKTDSNGNVFIIGSFQGTTDFDPSAATTSLTSLVEYDVFISKFDALGNFIWVKRFGGNSYQFGNAIDLDSQGNIYTTGSFQESVDFDPSITTSFNLVSGTSMNALSNIFVSKLDNDGNFLWAKQMGGNVLSSVAASLKLDNLGNVITTGYFTGTADFDPGSEVFSLSTVYRRNFISKLSSDGAFLWAKDFTANDALQGIAISVDSSNNIYTVGKFLGTVDFDPNAGLYPITAISNVEDIYISKLDSAGNFVWARSISGPTSYSRQSNSIWVDANNKILITGFFGDVCDFDPNDGVVNLTANGNFTDSFVLKMNQDELSSTAFLAKSNLSIYPNPASSSLNLQLETPIQNANLKLISVTGQTVFEVNSISGSNFAYEVSYLHSGLYIVKIVAGKDSYTSKFVKQ